MKLYLAGHTGLVGSALLRRFEHRPDVTLLTASRAELDLTDSIVVRRYLLQARPDVVILAAGLTGGIQANRTRPADFIYQNLMIEANVIHAAWQAGVARLLNFGSSCMYPKTCPQPMGVELLMSGKVEPTSEPYAVAKWAGLSLCASYSRQHGVRFMSAIPATVYGPNDSFDPEHSHVLSALLRKFHEAKAQGQHDVTLWGTGTPQREFVFADDLAEACELVLARYREEAPVNIGPGDTISIRDLATLAAEIVGFNGTIHWDASKPDGAPVKRFDASTMRTLGWAPRTSLRDGLVKTYAWLVEQKYALLEQGQAVQPEASCVSS